MMVFYLSISVLKFPFLAVFKRKYLENSERILGVCQVCRNSNVVSNHKNTRGAFEQQDVDRSYVLKQSSKGRTSQIVKKEDRKVKGTILDLI